MKCLPLSPQQAPLSYGERWLLAGFFLVVLLFGNLVQMRSVFLQRHMTDLQVYLRAAWAVRSDNNIYQVEDSNCWHYQYPPLLAILMTPLADPPPGVARTGMLPFGVSVLLWYQFNVACLFLGVHLLASALERSSADPSVRGQPWGCRRWWALRLVPTLACLPPLGHTLMRGQVNILLLALLCAMIAAAIRRRPFQAGIWLAGAICLKIIPVFLLVYPLWRRDRRWLMGCAAGLAIGLGLIPALVFGPWQTWAYGQQLVKVLVRPALGMGDDQSRFRELISESENDSQSIQSMLYKACYPDVANRPEQPSRAVRLAHWLIGGAMTLLTLLLAMWQRSDDGPATVMVLGSLAVIMILLSPVCHMHYFCLAVPLVMGMTAAVWDRQETLSLGWGLTAVLALVVGCTVVPHLPELRVLRELGLAGYAHMLLWLTGSVVLWRRSCSLLAAAEARTFRPVPGQSMHPQPQTEEVLVYSARVTVSSGGREVESEGVHSTTTRATAPIIKAKASAVRHVGISLR